MARFRLPCCPCARGEALLQNLAGQATDIAAVLTAINRAHTALNEGSLSCAVMQHQAALRYATLADTLALAQPQRTHDYLAALHRVGIRRLLLHTNAVTTAQTLLAAGTFPGRSGDLLHKLGVSPADMRVIALSAAKQMGGGGDVDLTQALADLANSSAGPLVPSVATTAGAGLSADPRACR